MNVFSLKVEYAPLDLMRHLLVFVIMVRTGVYD